MFSYSLFVSLATVGGTAVLLNDSLSLISDAAQMTLTHLTEVPSVIAAAELPPTTAHILVGAMS